MPSGRWPTSMPRSRLSWRRPAASSWPGPGPPSTGHCAISPTRPTSGLRQLGQAVEQSLLANLAAATGVSAKSASGANTAETTPLDQADALDEEGDDDRLSEALTLVIAAETGRIVATAEQARAETDLLLHFPDGVVPARVEPRTTATRYATTH